MVHVNINGDLFRIKVVKEWFGPLYWHEMHGNFSSESDSDGDFDGSPPLFNTSDNDGVASSSGGSHGYLGKQDNGEYEEVEEAAGRPHAGDIGKKKRVEMEIMQTL